MKYQMKRGVSQSLYKYLPESWIDFSVRGEERYNYIAHVTRWNSEKLDGINKRRLIRVVNQAIEAFGTAADEGTVISNTAGYGNGLTLENCTVLTPKHDGDERGIVAEISPLTFYCPSCHKVYQFKDSEVYQKYKRCRSCYVELKQMRQIYFCKCGFATDKHPVYCRTCKSSDSIYWSGKLNDYNFRCKKCGNKIPMFKKCDQCGTKLSPKIALDPSQYFAYSISLIDIIDENVEKFISDTDYGAILTLACWLGKITREELDEVIVNGITSDPDAYKKKYDDSYNMFIAAGLDQASAASKVVSREEESLVIHQGIGENQETDTQAVDSRAPQTDQTTQSIQPKPTKPEPPSKEILTDPTQKPDGTKQDTPPVPVDHEAVEKPSEPVADPEQPQAGDTSGNQIYVPGFGWVENHGGGGSGTAAEDMYENGNKIGIMD